ncbi:MAG: threonine ammonia-lyase, biosynthetic [Pseudomonadota bacterium]
MTETLATSILHAILDARVYDVAVESELDSAERLSSRLGNHIWLKREDQQPTFCYKVRGSYNKMSRLTDRERKRGVIAASAGNHAQGVAKSAQEIGCDAVIVMPVTTPAVKLQAVERWGARVELVGDSFDEAYQRAMEIQKKENRVFVHPFDDPDVIAGQGTVAPEILRQLGTKPLHAVFVPVGGGGLIAGLAAYIKQLRPDVQVIGVEPEEADSMAKSLEAGRRVRLKKVGIFADGVAVKQVGAHTFKLCREFVDEIVTVSTDEICAAIKDICEDTRTLVEPSGALGVAGIKRWLRDQKGHGNRVRGKHIVAILSGANMNFDRLRHVSERAEIGERREAILAVTIPEHSGSYLRFISILGDRNVSEFNYRYANESEAHIFLGVQINRTREIESLVRRLQKQGYQTTDLTDNEIAKVHIRHLVGGRAPDVKDERLISFEFPERPGALKNFLDQVGTDWNITLFHYRNHGSDFGRVLCGMQVAPGRQREFRKFLRKLGYQHTDETDNPVHRLFLA